MTAFSDHYDAIVTRLAALLTGHTRLANAYDLELNAETALRQGWALGVAPGENTFRYVNGTRSLRVGLTLAVTRQVVSLEQDPVKRAAIDKALVADVEAIFDDVHTNNLGASGALVRALGIQGVQSVGDRHRALTLNIDLEYFRD